MTRNVQKTLGIRFALLVGAAIPLILATSVRAQDQAAPAASPAGPGPGGTEATAERVIVTGSNIPTAEEVGPNPVDTYRRDDITRLGVRTPTDLVQRIPSVQGGSTTEGVNNGGDGSTRIDLRGIDPKETLILEDGRRIAIAPSGFSSPDFNQFPLGLIDHIDILKDGASPVYGTDAVDGVVNVYLIHRFRGLEMYASYGNTNLGFAGDQGQETEYILGGTGDDKTDVVVYAGMYQAAAIFTRDNDLQHDADLRPFNGKDFRSSNMPTLVFGNGAGYPGRYLPTHNGGALSPTPHSYANVENDPQYTNRNELSREQRKFNFADLTPSVSQTDREFLYGSVIRDICDKYLTVFADFKYFRQFWNGGFAPIPFVPDPFTDINNPFGISLGGGLAISVPTQNPFNPFTVADYTSPGGFNTQFPDTSASAAPAGTQFTTGVAFRGIEAGLRQAKFTTNNYLFTGGLKGNLGEFANAWDTLKTWEWESAVRWSEDSRLNFQPGYVNASALRIALLSTDPATAFNPFSFAPNTKFVKDHVYANLIAGGDDQLLTEDLKLNGDLFNLPGGPVAFAIGGEHLGDELKTFFDPLTQSGQALGATAAKATKGNRDAWSVYWETKIPVTGPTWNFPGAYSLEFDYSERFESYSDFGQTERPKFSVRWQPIDTALTLRAAYIEAFRAPALVELFAPDQQAFPTITDAISNNHSIEQPQQISSGNRQLKPEIAYEYTYGGVLTPGKWWSPLQGLTLSADFIHIHLNDYVTTVDPQFVVNNAPPGQSTSTTEIGGSFGNTINGPGGSVQRDANGNIVLIRTPFFNAGTEILSMWD